MVRIKTFADARDASSEVWERLLAHNISPEQADKMCAALGKWLGATVAEIAARRERQNCENEADKKAFDTLIGDEPLPKTIDQPKGRKRLSPGKK